MLAVVDTSFWIDHRRGALRPEERSRIEQLWQTRGAVLYQFVWLELVIAYRSPEEQRDLQNYRAASHWESIKEEDPVKAETFARVLRAKGHTVGASDLLILAAADRLGARLLHHDNDFTLALKYPEFVHLAWPT